MQAGEILPTRGEFAADPDEHGGAVDAEVAGEQEDEPFDIMGDDVEPKDVRVQTSLLAMRPQADGATQDVVDMKGPDRWATLWRFQLLQIS